MKKDAIANQLEEIKSLLRKKNDHAYRQAGKPLNFNQAAEYLGFSHSYLYKLTSRKIIPCHRPTGKMLFFSKEELDEWIVSSEKSKGKSETAETEKWRKGEEVNDEEEEPP